MKNKEKWRKISLERKTGRGGTTEVGAQRSYERFSPLS